MYLENAQPVYNYVRYLDIAKLIKQAGKCSDRELKLYYKSRYLLETLKGVSTKMPHLFKIAMCIVLEMLDFR